MGAGQRQDTIHQRVGTTILHPRTPGTIPVMVEAGHMAITPRREADSTVVLTRGATPALEGMVGMGVGGQERA